MKRSWVTLACLLACGCADTIEPEPSRTVEEHTMPLSAAKPNDPYFKEQWQLESSGPFTTSDNKGSIVGGDHAHVAQAWGLIQKLGLAQNIEDIGKSVKLAVIDDGFDLLHDDLAGKVIASKNFGTPVPEGNLFQTSPSDFHGMLVTGIAVANANDGKGIAGVCPGCRLIAARMPADASTVGKTAEDLYDEIFAWVTAQGADVINASFGPDRASNKDRLKAVVQKVTREGRAGLGTVMVFASGNKGEDMAWNAFASSDDTLSVGGTNSLGARYDFSNFGSGLDLMAPTSGGEKRSQGLSSLYIDRIWTTDNYQAPSCLAPGATPSSGCSDTMGWTPARNMAGGDGWVGKYSYRFSHTSAAAPLVSGVVGLMLHVSPKLSNSDIRSILRASADKVSQSDAGYDASGFSEKYGFGRVNALRAVALAHTAGGGTLDASTRAEIDALSPCTRVDCWDAAGSPAVPPPDMPTEGEVADDAGTNANGSGSGGAPTPPTQVPTADAGTQNGPESPGAAGGESAEGEPEARGCAVTQTSAPRHGIAWLLVGLTLLHAGRRKHRVKGKSPRA